MSGMKWRGPTGPTVGSRGVGDKGKVIGSGHIHMKQLSVHFKISGNRRNQNGCAIQQPYKTAEEI